MRRKRVVIFLIVMALVLLGLVVIYYFKRQDRSADSSGQDIGGTTETGAIGFEQRNRQAMENDQSPEAQADYRMIIAGQYVNDKKYGEAIELYNQVLSISNIPGGKMQSARQGAMRAYALSGDFSKAIDLAKQYKQNIDSTAPSGTAEKEHNIIDQAISQLESGSLPNADVGVGD